MEKTELISKLQDKNSKVGNLHGTKEAQKMSLLELMAKVHEEDAETVLAAKEYIRKPNEANLTHLLYELIDGQMIRESIIGKYVPEKLMRDSMRDDVYQANRNCYHYDENQDNDSQDDDSQDHIEYSTFDDTDSEEDDETDEPADVMYEVCHWWKGELHTDEIFDTRDEAIKTIFEYHAIDRERGLNVKYIIKKFTLEESELVIMEG